MLLCSDPSHPLCPAGHLPRKGGDLRARRLSRISTTAGMSQASKLPISPLAGEMAGRPEGGAVPPTSHVRKVSDLSNR
ncbi:MAG: hypothetical protein EOR48_06240 [Mesorhizobium sp.]|nr:MAG: hypothetical protein EOR48_06240 [Mesorhizobium sp.]TIP48649.1 MAG: hypothetical protein E5X62_02170 [Mesorhizobium sp.]